MTFDIMWKGKIGYGDIISPICYAINQQKKRNDNVRLTFHWNHVPGTKFKEQDPETIDERAQFIFDYLNPTGVELVNKFQSNLQVNHFGYGVQALDPNEKYHNVYLDVLDDSMVGEPIKIALCTTRDNKKKFTDYAPGKAWKDPLGDDWETLSNALSSSDITEVSYNTPIADLFEIIKSCDLFIGYHGSCSWVARLLQKPMIVFSENKKFSEWAFPWCYHATKIDDITNLYNAKNLSQLKLETCHSEYRSYVKVTL